MQGTTGAVREAEEYLRSLRHRGSGAAQLAAIYRRDYHTCDCPLPYVERKWNEALGLFAEIRLCCLARAVEALTGLTLFETFEFDPLWEWDCDAMVPERDGSLVRRGPPPAFLRERMERKGILIKNLNLPRGDGGVQ